MLVDDSPLGSVSDDMITDNKTYLLRFELVSYEYRATREIGDDFYKQIKQIEVKTENLVQSKKKIISRPRIGGYHRPFNKDETAQTKNSETRHLSEDNT